MRLALTAATTLGLASLAETLPLQIRRARRRRQLLREKSSALSSSSPLWKQASRHLVAGNKPCDPFLEEEEPDVGILSQQQCAPGYSCQSLSSSEGSEGICISDHIAAAARTLVQQQQRGRQLQGYEYDYCQLQIDYLGYACNCTNWVDNVGSYECVTPLPDTAYFGFPVSQLFYTMTNVDSAGAPPEYGFRLCSTALDDTLAGFVQSYCTTDYLQIKADGNATSSDKGCTVTMNGKPCDSCTSDFCTDTATVKFTDSFDCSNVNADAVVDDVCGGNTIWKQLLAEEYPTAAPVIVPTIEPSIVGVDTPSPANDDGIMTEAPAPIVVDDGGDSAPTSTGEVPTATGDVPTSAGEAEAPTSGEQPAAAADESRGFVAAHCNILPAVMGCLIGMVVALNK